MRADRRDRRGSTGSGTDVAAAGGRLLPVIGGRLPVPVAAKVPEIVALFWVVKILTTAGGEVTSDYLGTFGNVIGVGTEVLLLVAGLLVQFGTRRYRAFAYWFLAYAVAILGTGLADFLHVDVGLPYAVTTLMWVVVLVAVFWRWQRSEGTLSVHSVTDQRREAFYWSTVFATFALGTALGDFTAASLNLGFLTSGIVFGVLITIPALARRWFDLNEIAAFWMAYVVTRPLGASFSDWVSKPHSGGGLGLGDGTTAALCTLAVLGLVTYLAIVRPDVQRPVSLPGARKPVETATGGPVAAGRPTAQVP